MSQPSVRFNEDQIKQQLVMHNKVFNMIGCNAKFRTTAGTYSGKVVDMQWRLFNFCYKNEDGKEVKQPIYIVNGFILEDGNYIPLPGLETFTPLE